jgi:hypothetical protein
VWPRSLVDGEPHEAVDELAVLVLDTESDAFARGGIGEALEAARPEVVGNDRADTSSGPGRPRNTLGQMVQGSARSAPPTPR